MDRIKKISSFIDDYSSVIDVGCDHGYLCVELLKQDRGINVIASDISKNAVISAKEKTKKQGYDIDFRCGSGLDIVNKNEIDVVVIAGMGSCNQLDILINGMEKLENVKTIILSPNDYNGAFNIRNNLDKIGYYVYNEDIVCENDIFYPILVLKKGNVKYSYSDILLGPILKDKNTDLVLLYYKYILDKKINILDSIPLKYEVKRKEILKDTNIINKKIALWYAIFIF